MTLLDILKEFLITYNSLSDELITSLYDNLENGKSIQDSVDQSLQSTDFVYNVEDSLLSSIADCFALNTKVDDETELRDALLFTPWIDNISLRDRLDNISSNLVSQLTDTLNSVYLSMNNIKGSININMSDLDLYNIQRKIQSLRLYAGYDEVQQVMEKLSKFKSEKNTDNMNGLVSVLSLIYLPTLKGVISNYVNKSLRDKYIGLNNTEGARANYEGIIKENKGKVGFFGFKWVLSPTHYRFPFDICDVNANADVGYGKGIYPKNKVPIYPAHKHCICTMEPVFNSDIGDKANNTFSDKGINKYIDSLSSSDKSRLFSRDKLNTYKSNGDYRLMNSYSGYEYPKART